MKVPFFDYPSIYSAYRSEFIKIFDDVCSRGAFILQEDLSRFEENLAETAGVSYAVGVGNATDALRLLLLSSGLQPGDEVIMSSHTMLATAGAVRELGGIPVVVDVASDHSLDSNLVSRYVSSKTKYILPTQLNGRICDMDELCRIAKSNDLQIVEDSAQALGASYKERFAGGFGIGGCISFYPAKTLGCFGDGGAVLTNHEEVACKIKVARDHGRGPSGKATMWGYNSRLDNLQAAILDFQIQRYPQVIERRRELAQRYHDALSGIPFLTLPEPPSQNLDRVDIFQNYELLADRRNQLRDHLKMNGVGTLVQWGGTMLHQHRRLDIRLSGDFERSENISNNSLMLPLNMSITEQQQEYVIREVSRFYGF